MIDDKGILRQITINDLPVGRSVDEILRLIQAFQFTDKHGEGERRGTCSNASTVSSLLFLIVYFVSLLLNHLYNFTISVHAFFGILVLFIFIFTHKQQEQPGPDCRCSTLAQFYLFFGDLV